MSLDDDLLSDDPDSQAVDADDDARYTTSPDENDQVIVVEPPIISIGRARRKRELRQMPEEQK